MDAVIQRLLLACLLLVSTPIRAGALPEPMVIGETHVLHSSVLDEDRRYTVALPEGYGTSPDERYPVLYVLDAQSQFAHTATTVDFLARNGEMPPTIVVGVEAGNRLRDYTQTDWAEAWVGGGGAANFERFLRDELIPAVRRQWRTGGFRTMVGHSASAQFALHELAVAADGFRAYFAFSPSLDWDNGLPRRELEAAFAKTQSMRAFAYFGYSDDRGGALAADEALTATFRQHGPAGLRWKARSYPDESHTGIALVAIIDALRALYSDYRFHPDRMGEGLDAIEAHYAKLSKVLGWTLPVPESALNDYGYYLLGAETDRDVDAAVAIFQRVVREHPHSANAWDSLADCYAAAGRSADAGEASQRALSLAREQHHPNLSYFAAQAEQREQRRDE